MINVICYFIFFSVVNMILANSVLRPIDAELQIISSNAMFKTIHRDRKIFSYI